MLSLFSLVFATYRIARLIAVDEGPAGVFFRTRLKLGAYDYGEDGQPKSAWGRGISCPHCVGLYVAPALWGLQQLPGGDVVVLILAVAGLQSVLWSVVDGDISRAL